MGHARPRRQAARRREGRRGADADARARVEGDVETRYGGRYVQAVDGIEGSLDAQRDWFWFVNGYEGDRSAASYRLRDGDVAWLDYRGWQREGEARVVVGAFPEPFLHGYDGKTRPAAVRYDAARETRATELARTSAPASVEPLGTPVPAGANVLELRAGPSRLTAELLGETAGDPVALRLARRSDADAAGTRSREPRPRSAPARRGRHGRAAGRPALGGRAADGRAARRLPARARRSAAGVYLFGALSTGLGVLVLSPFLWSSAGRDDALGGADGPGARAARRDDDGARPRRRSTRCG